jgi:hypothetical protein
MADTKSIINNGANFCSNRRSYYGYVCSAELQKMGGEGLENLRSYRAGRFVLSMAD